MKNIISFLLLAFSMMCLSCSNDYSVSQLNNSQPIIIDGETCNVFYIERGISGLFYIKCPSGSSVTHTNGKTTISTSTNKIPLDSETTINVPPVEKQNKNCNCGCEFNK